MTTEPMTTSSKDPLAERAQRSAMQQFSCRLCQQPVLSRPWGGGECEACGSVSMPLLPSKEEISAFYATYNQQYTGGGASAGRNLRRYANRYLQIVQQHRRSGRLIDVGSSNNPFPNQAADAGFEVTMMDFVRPPSLHPAVQYFEGNMNDERALEVGQQAFDIVTSWAVMEHVPDPRRSAAILAALCKPGGLIVLSTPETGTTLTRLAIGHSPWFYPPEHLNLISPKAFELLFTPLGCRLKHWGRLELSMARYLARYGIGLASALLGGAAKALAPKWWHAQRVARKQTFQGVTYFVFEKT
jgi:SAM-dependent methyltransferase